MQQHVSLNFGTVSVTVQLKPPALGEDQCCWWLEAGSSLKINFSSREIIEDESNSFMKCHEFRREKITFCF